MAKFILPDDSPKNKKRMVAASGGFNTQSTENTQNNYVKSAVANTPLAKFSQTSGGGNVTWTQPSFFSPMHTAQNWQVPSRRRELIQWSFIDNKESPCYITKDGDFSLVNIKDIVEKYDDLSKIYIQNGKGEKATIDKAVKRYVNKKANKIRVLGVAEDLHITNDHDCMVIKRKDIKCSKAEGSKFRISICDYTSDFCKRKKCDDCINKEYKISKIKARNVEKGDYVLVPFDKTVRKSVIQDEEQARFAGHLASDGYIYERGKYTSICMNTEEVNDVFPCIERVFNDHSVVSTIPRKYKSKKLISFGTSKRSLFKFSF